MRLKNCLCPVLSSFRWTGHVLIRNLHPVLWALKEIFFLINMMQLFFSRLKTTIRGGTWSTVALARQRWPWWKITTSFGLQVFIGPHSYDRDLWHHRLVGFLCSPLRAGTEMKRRVGGHLLRINGYYFSEKRHWWGIKDLKCKYQLYSSSTAAFSEVFGEGYERSWLHVMEISFDFRPTAEFGGCNFVLIFRLRRIVSARTDVAFDTVCITWHVCSLEFAIACLSIKDFLVSNGGAKGEWRSGTDWKYQTHVKILVILWLFSGLENLAKHRTFNNKECCSKMN